MLLHVAVSLVACSISVNVTLAQTIENHLFGPNPFRDILVLNFYVRGKVCYPSVQIYTGKTRIGSDVKIS